MFDKNFYPTPESVIRKMLEGEKLDYKMILEPSAGKGDILDYILDKKVRTYNRGKDYCRNNLYAIEKNNDLKNILLSKEYKVVGDDFLNYSTDYIFDYIIMNPPFDAGAKHLLKALEIARGAKVICLLNAETINNPYTGERKLLQNIIKEYGTVEFLGSCFSNSERKTNVEIALVKIQDESYKIDFNFEGKKESEEEIKDNKKFDLAHKDNFGNLELRYNKVKEISKKILELQSELDYYGSDIMTDTSKLFAESIKTTKTAWYNNFVESFRRKAWDKLINKTNVSEFTTEKVRTDFYKKQNLQGFMGFTKENMVKFFEDLFYNQETIMQQCVEEAFDLMTKYYEENRVHIEGWKTNDRWKVNRKVILPNMRDNWNSYPWMSYDAKNKIIDIEKAICFISGKKISNIKTIVSLYDDKKMQFGEWYNSTFFRFKMYKKGTMHLEFNTKELYEKFNITACKMKNWLGN